MKIKNIISIASIVSVIALTAVADTKPLKLTLSDINYNIIMASNTTSECLETSQFEKKLLITEFNLDKLNYYSSIGVFDNFEALPNINIVEAYNMRNDKLVLFFKEYEHCKAFRKEQVPYFED